MSSLKDRIALVGNFIHRSVFVATNGRVFGKFLGMPVVMLTTIGRRSGQKRTVMLTSPVQEGESVVLVASYGGDRHHPTWFLNLRENPDVEAVVGGKKQAMRARVASAEERERLWPRVVKKYRGYAQYQERTDREIPLVILDPA